MPFRPSPIALSHSLPPSSRVWLSRQFRDPYVKKRLSHPAAYRSRSAFKLLEIDEKWGGFLTKPYVNTVVDLGAAPGGWSQVVAGKLGWTVDSERSVTRAKNPLMGNGYGFNRRTKLDKYGTWSTPPPGDAEEELDGLDPQNDDYELLVGQGTIVAVDLLPIMAIPGVHTLKVDFLSPKAEILIKELLTCKDNPDGRADVILSDMAANFSGNKIHDTESSLEICDAVLRFAQTNLRTPNDTRRNKGGVLLLKHFTHPLLQKFRIENLEPNFRNVKYIKPDASRATSGEGYWLCEGWYGAKL